MLDEVVVKEPDLEDVNRFAGTYSMQKVIELNVNESVIATLWVKDSMGNEDVDFCQVRVFSKTNPEIRMPHLEMSYAPTMDLKPNQPVHFRFWMQGETGGPIQVEFDDGTRMNDCKPDSEFTHSFKNPGIHIVTAQCEVNGKPIMQKLKVVVEASDI